MTDILAIDPGEQTGWALGEGAGQHRLRGCGHGEDWPWHQFNRALIERPEIYSKGKAAPNSIGTLLIRVGTYKERLKIYCKVECEEVFPKEWKGSVSKKTHHLRGRRKMFDFEKAMVDAAVARMPSHEEDIKDAVNLYLWRVGRLPKSEG